MNLLLLAAVQAFAAGNHRSIPRLHQSALLQAPRMAMAPSHIGGAHLGPISNEGGAEDGVVDDGRPYWEDFPGARVTGVAATGPAQGPRWVEKEVLRQAFLAAPNLSSLRELDGRWLAVEYGADHEGAGSGFGYEFSGGSYKGFQARANGERWAERKANSVDLERGAAIDRRPAGTRTIYLMYLGESREEAYGAATFAFRRESADSILLEVTAGSDVRYYRLNRHSLI